jgi:hypothetical protein
MKRQRKKLRGIWAGIILTVLALAGTGLVFLTRPPVLVVTDASFTALYGPQRVLISRIRSSLALFRLVRPVMIAEDAGPDVLVFAVEDLAAAGFSRPYCVLFPYRYADGARRYREQFPGIPVVVLEGRSESEPGTAGTPDSQGILRFSTDIEQDLYRAGRCAAILGRGTAGKTVVFQDRTLQSEARNAVITGLRTQGSEAEPLFLNSISALSDSTDISCVIIAGSEEEYFEQIRNFPLILCTWMDPELAPREAIVFFDDSPWAQTVPVVRMIAGKMTGGRIPSDMLIFSERIADKDILREIKTAVRGFM